MHHTDGLEVRGNLSSGCIRVEDFFFLLRHCFCREGGEGFTATPDVAAAGGADGHEGLSAEVIALNEGVDDARLLFPPNRIGDDDRIVLCHVFNLACNRGARDGIILLDGCACYLIVLVKVMRRV